MTMLRLPISFRLCGALLLAVIALLGVGALHSVAAAPRQQQTAGDSQCRGCHGDNQRSLTLPSGEELKLLVDLTRLDATAHSSAHANAVACTACHFDAEKRARYRYPHAENPAQTLVEFRAEVAQNCEGCHYPHLPFHKSEQSDYTPPTCVDCHGSHTIARVDQLAEVMPANCLACHSDKTAAWAAEFVAPRPGLGNGNAEYAGSARCAGCHEDKYFTWDKTLHARMVQDPKADERAILGDFFRTDPNLTFGLNDVAYTIGSRWKQVYLTQTVTGTLTILPAQWNMSTRSWAPYHGDGAPGDAWLPSCGGCHVTGLDTSTWGFTEFNIGCEGCHGPGAAHASAPKKVKPVAKPDDQVCGSCHSRGESPEGYPFPAMFRPGDTLTDHFTFAQDEAVLWPDGSARRNHQQYMDWMVGGSMQQSGKVQCVTCHSPHDSDASTGQLNKPLNDLCLQCHNERDQQAMARHVPFHEKALQKRDFYCTDCHMPKLAASAAEFEMHTHTFQQPNPQGTLDHGGLEAMPNACNRCHTGSGETPEWATQIIEFAAAQTQVSASAFFGPGPTPTSPPPPTPIASVGQPVVRAVVSTGRWLRTTAFVILGLLVVAGVAAIVRAIFMRGKKDA